MRELREVLQDGFQAHVGALGSVGEAWDGLAGRAVRDTRHRRAWRAGAASTVAAATLVGIVATAVAVTGGGEGGDALNPAHRLVMEDPNSLGPCDAYIPANGALLPDGLYVGRAYVDPAAGFVVAVTPDGTVSRVQPGPDGDYPFDFGSGPRSLMVPTEYPVVIDFSGDAGGGGIWVDAAAASWDWTMEPMPPAPAGVNVKSLMATFAMTLGFGGGQGYVPGDVPEGAVAQVVAIYSDGSEIAGALVRDLPAPSLDQDIDATGLEAVALRVTLADGEVWEVLAAYTPEDRPILPCQPTPPSGPLELPSEAPTTAAEPGVSEGPSATEPQAVTGPLAGPESVVFQCGAPLPADLQDSGDVTAERASGVVTLDGPDVFDVGAEGIVIEAGFPLWEMDMDGLNDAPRSAGWQTTGGSQGDGPFYGNVGLTEVVAVREGVIVGAASEPVEDWTAGGIGGAMLAYRNTGDPLKGGFISAYNGIHGILEPCEGIEAGDLEGAQLAVLYGFGPDATEVEYGWTLVAPE